MHNFDNTKSSLHDLRSSKLFIYTVVNLAVFTDSYLYGLIIPVLPFALVDLIHLDGSNVQRWIGILLGAYGAGLIIGSPIAGWYADRTSSRRGPYLLGLIALAASTLALSLGRTLTIYFIGRFVQGASSAAVHTVGLAILADTAGKSGIGPAMGFVGVSIALGMVSGPMLGGLLYHRFGYAAVFVSGYVLVGVDFFMRVLLIMPAPREEEEEPGERDPLKTDPGAYGTFADENAPLQRRESRSSLAPSTTSTTTSSTPPSSPPPTPPSSSLTTPTPTPSTLPLLLLTPRFLTALLGDLTQSIILTLLETILPLHIHTLFHLLPTRTALLFLPLSLPAFFAPLIGALSDRHGTKNVVTAGFLLTSIFLVSLRFISRDSAGMEAALVGLLLSLGTSLGLILTPVWAEATYVVDELVERGEARKGGYATAFGLMNVAYAVGSLVGPLIGGLGTERWGWERLVTGAGMACLVGLLPVVVWMGGRRGEGGI